MPQSWSWRRGLSVLTAVLALGGVASSWFLPAGQSCIMFGAPRPEQCTTSSMWSGVPNHLLALVLLAASAAFALLPLYGARARWVLLAWAGLVIGFYLLSFGVDSWLLPAALLAVAAALSPGRTA